MKVDILHSISAAIVGLSQLNSNDILVNVLRNKVVPIPSILDHEKIEVTLDETLLSILKQTNHFVKEAGTNPLCVAASTICWEVKQKQVSSPLVLIPCSHSTNKVKNTVVLEMVKEEAFINPFLIHFLSSEFGLSLPKFPDSNTVVSELVEWLTAQAINFTLHDTFLLGNFHHHRYQIVKDLEGFEWLEEIGSNVQVVLGKEDGLNAETLELTDAILFPSDNDQLDVFETVKKYNTVVHGPPGTGKSQVLANLLGKVLHAGANALVVSEKRVALEVLQKKLGEFQLDDFVFISTCETISNDFIRSLKNGWEKMEKRVASKVVNLQLSTEHLARIQLQFNLLSKKDLIGGIGYDEFMSLIKDVDFSKFSYVSEAPTMKEWGLDKEGVFQIYRANLQEVLALLPREVIGSDGFDGFDSKVSHWRKSLDELVRHFEIHQVKDLEAAMRLAAVCQMIENETEKSHVPLLNPEGKERKKYKQLKKKWALLQLEISKLNHEKLNWKIEPSENEAKQLLLACNASSYFTRRNAKRRSRSLVRSKFTDLEQALTNWLLVLKLQGEKLEVRYAFQTIGVQDPETDLVIIDSFLQRLDKKEWSLYHELLPERRRNLCSFHRELNHLHSILKSYFKVEENHRIGFVFDLILKNFEQLTILKRSILALHRSTYRLIAHCRDLQSLEGCVLKSNWVKFESQFPLLSNFDPVDLAKRVGEIIRLQGEESRQFAEQIKERIHRQFQEFHALLRTPHSRLSTEKKALKESLKKGKSILVKEFSKSRSHPSVRELLQTEAAVWIHLLKPIWLSNPHQIARCFPLQKEMFDFVLFDEASQIPLFHTLGALHRGKRVVVSGDEQQMSPSAYFKTGSTETIDVLHQTRFYFKNRYLKHHYRSAHPELIAFSNQHFYQNSLIAYPSAARAIHPLQWIYCEQGVYDEQKNEVEAMKVAHRIADLLAGSNSIGVVAFSEQQLSCIWSHLDPKVKLLLSHKLEEGKSFFKTLEQVQGEECDDLVISLGYGKNATGDFHMRFGPLNQKLGAKRLNVLLTRARKSMQFVSSVTSHHFKLSENESVNLLRLFLLHLEQMKTGEKEDQPAFVFPYGLKPRIIEKASHNEVHLDAIYSVLSDANELVTLQRTLQQRGWKVFY